jgi:hypothetical protein
MKRALSKKQEIFEKSFAVKELIVILAGFLNREVTKRPL